MKRTWHSNKPACWFHRWGNKQLITGVEGIDCDYIRWCSKCGVHQTWPSGQARPYHFPSSWTDEQKATYQQATGNNVNII